MSTQSEDTAYEAAVSMAAALKDEGLDFVVAVGRAATAYSFDWYEIQKGMTERAANVNHSRAVKRNSRVDEIKKLTCQFRAEQRAQKKQAKEQQKAQRQMSLF